MGWKTVLKIAIPVFAVAYTAQTIGGLVVLKRLEDLEKEYIRVYHAGIYAFSILERQQYELTEFDALALEALRPDKKNPDIPKEEE